MRLFMLVLALPLAAASAQFEITKTGVEPRVGIHLGVPAVISLGFGGALVTKAKKLHWHEYFAMVEPGMRAGRVSIGMGDWHRDEDPHRGPGFGFTARATLLRRWNGKVDYAGLEFSTPLWGPRIGFFTPISGNTSEKVRLTADMSLGW